MKTIQTRLKAQKGVTALEYGVIAAVSIVAIVAGLALIGPRMTSIFKSVANALKT